MKSHVSADVVTPEMEPTVPLIQLLLPLLLLLPRRTLVPFVMPLLHVTNLHTVQLYAVVSRAMKEMERPVRKLKQLQLRPLPLQLLLPLLQLLLPPRIELQLPLTHVLFATLTLPVIKRNMDRLTVNVMMVTKVMAKHADLSLLQSRTNPTSLMVVRTMVPEGAIQIKEVVTELHMV